ncbi:MAG: septum formation initiator family protein [Patescibacteria group bacterium]
MKTQGGFKNFFSSKIFLLLALVAAVFTSIVFSRAYYQEYQVRQEINRLQDETAKLESKKIELLKAWQYAKSDTYTEERARLELNLVKPGEKVAVISSNGSENSGQKEENKLEWESVPNPIKWFKFFFNF